MKKAFLIELYSNRLTSPSGSVEQRLGSTSGSCPPAHFQCASGGCADPGSRCNGLRDCIDNSDEANCQSEFLMVFRFIVFDLFSGCWPRCNWADFLMVFCYEVKVRPTRPDTRTLLTPELARQPKILHVTPPPPREKTPARSILHANDDVLGW